MPAIAISSAIPPKPAASNQREPVGLPVFESNFSIPIASLADIGTVKRMSDNGRKDHTGETVDESTASPV